MLRKPRPEDGLAIHQLIKRCPPLDCNSGYSYHLLCRHYADTCVVAEQNRTVVGFISAYIRPDAPDTLFIWQVAVDPSARGKGIAQLMLSAVAARPECTAARYLETTVGRDNDASRGLFRGFASSRDAELEETIFLETTDFDEPGHEAEWLLRIGPMNAGKEKKIAHL